MEENMGDREALSVSEAAETAGIGRSTFYELLDRGEGPATFTIGRRRLVRVEAVREWLADLEAAENGGAQDDAD